MLGAGAQAGGDGHPRLAFGEPGVNRRLKQCLFDLKLVESAAGDELAEIERRSVERVVPLSHCGPSDGFGLALEGSAGPRRGVPYDLQIGSSCQRRRWRSEVK